LGPETGNFVACPPCRKEAILLGARTICRMAFTVRVVGSPKNGILCTLQVESSWLVVNLKAAIEEAAGVLQSEQRLLASGRPLRDREVLGDIFPKNKQATVTLVRVDPSKEAALKATFLDHVRGGGSLFDVDDYHRCDRDVVLAAVKADGGALRLVPEEIQSDREVALTAVQGNGHALCVVAPQLRADREIVLAAVRGSGDVLWCAAEELRRDREFMLDAVQRDGIALRYASRELLKDTEFVLGAIQRNASALRHAPEELRHSRKFVFAAVRLNPGALEHAAEPLRREGLRVWAASQAAHENSAGPSGRSNSNN